MNAPIAPVFDCAANAKRVAVFSSCEIIGDGLYKLPVLRALRMAFPQAQITWITTGSTVFAHKLAPLTQGLIDEFRENSGLGANMFSLLRPLPFHDAYDLIIDTQNIIWRTLTVRRLPHGAFISSAADFRWSDRRPEPGRVPPVHMVDRLMELIELAAGPISLPKTPLPIPDDILARAARLLPDPTRTIAIAPGAGKRIKCWPLENFIALACRWEARGFTPAFIIGPDETEWIAPLRESVPSALFPEQDDLWGGRFSPLHTIALARFCRVALANDSGVSHMFGAADVPLLTLYGPTQAEKFRPRVTHGRILRARDFGSQNMDAIPIESVDHELSALLHVERIT